MATYKNLPDDELLPLIKRELFSAIIGDVLDKMGYLHCFLPPRVRALREDMILAGRAMPVLEVDLPVDAPAERKPFGLMLEALDDLKTHEVYVAAGASAAYAVCRWDGGGDRFAGYGAWRDAIVSGGLLGEEADGGIFVGKRRGQVDSE